MRAVLDSCVALKTVLPETDTPKAVRLLNEFRVGLHELLAPDVFPVDVAHHPDDAPIATTIIAEGKQGRSAFFENALCPRLSMFGFSRREALVVGSGPLQG